MLKSIKADSRFKIQAVLLCGDYVETGSNEKDAKDFIDDYVCKFEKELVPCLCTLGNHDVYVSENKNANKLTDFTKSTLQIPPLLGSGPLWAGVCYPYSDKPSDPAGGYYRSFKIRGCVFFACGIYPNSKTVFLDPLIADYVKGDMLTGPARKDKTPVFFFFHYNIQGAFSDWWDDDEKDYFYEVIKDLNVKAIFCGHNHFSEYYEWKKKKIPVYQVGGTQFAKVTINYKTSCKIELVSP